MILGVNLGIVQATLPCVAFCSPGTSNRAHSAQ
jgi:hypothetical protein